MIAVGCGGGCRRCDGIVDDAIEFDETEEPQVKPARPARKEAARCSWLDLLLVGKVTAGYLEVLD